MPECPNMGQCPFELLDLRLSAFRIYKPLKIIDKHNIDLFHGVLIDIHTKDQTPELISLAERESS